MLPLRGSRTFNTIHRSTILDLARDVGVAPAEATRLLIEVLDALRHSWTPSDYPPHHRDLLIAHWRKVPLLKGAGALPRE